MTDRLAGVIGFIDSKEHPYFHQHEAGKGAEHDACLPVVIGTGEFAVVVADDLRRLLRRTEGVLNQEGEIERLRRTVS